jgi:hypothetical protein
MMTWSEYQEKVVDFFKSIGAVGLLQFLQFIVIKFSFFVP